MANKIRVIKSRRIRWVCNVACIECLVGKPEGKKLLGRTRDWWEYNMKMDIKETGLKVVWT
jgi:hypothetical protein